LGLFKALKSAASHKWIAPGAMNFYYTLNSKNANLLLHWQRHLASGLPLRG